MNERPVMAIRVDDEIQLRLIEERHAREYYALIDRNREHLRPWMGWVDYETGIETTREFIHQRLLAFANSHALQLGAWYKGELVGSFSFNQINWSTRKTEIGYWIDEGAQGKGIATRVCRTLLSLAFDEYQLNKVEIRAAEENNRSRAVPERLGFKQEGTLRDAEWLYDHYVDHVVYGMLAREWRAS
jgi:ribosomal-protein-serine acetyltransferase